MYRDFSPGASYGWRARIGMLVPPLVFDTNVHEFYLMAPAGVELFITSLGVQRMSQGEYDRAIAGFEDTLQRVVAYKPDAIVQAGVPPIVTRGWGFEEELQALVKRVTQAPFFSDMGASLLAMRTLGCKRIVMLSGVFEGELVEQIRRYLAAAGVELVGAGTVEGAATHTAPALPLEMIYRTGRDLYRRHAATADGLWITQANMPSVGVIAQLEGDLGVPVVSSAQAIAWAGLRAAGVRDAVPGFGHLFEHAEIPM